jgi:conjugative transfer region protein (TIGR03750 family)
MAHDHGVLAERVIAEPVIFRGCASSELGLLLGAAVAFWLPAALLLSLLIGAPALSVGLAAGGILATVWLAAGILQRLKRGRPEGYYQQGLTVWLHQHHLKRSPLILRSGVWDVGRRLP